MCGLCVMDATRVFIEAVSKEEEQTETAFYVTAHTCIWDNMQLWYQAPKGQAQAPATVS